MGVVEGGGAEFVDTLGVRIGVLGGVLVGVAVGVAVGVGEGLVADGIAIGAEVCAAPGAAVVVFTSRGEGEMLCAAE